MAEHALPVAQHENVLMQSADLPVNIFFRRSDAATHGCEFHWHEALEFYYVRRGAVSLQCGGTRVWLRPGDIGFVNWCAPHRGTAFLDETEHYIIQISDLFLGQEAEALSTLLSDGGHLPVVFHDTGSLIALLDTVIEEAAARRTGCALEIRAAVLRILAFLLRSAGGAQHAAPDTASLEHLRRVLAFLSGHCTEPEAVTLPALSRRFGLSVPYLCRIMKLHTNTTLTAYINELRCDRAAALIRAGTPLSEAAARTGFRDYNYFSRTFRRVRGTPPSSCRCEAET